jgi:hypothetical protein
MYYNSGYGKGRVILSRLPAIKLVPPRRTENRSLGRCWRQSGRSFDLDCSKCRFVFTIYLFLIPDRAIAVPDPRITIGIPIVGCPDYLKLMTARAQESSVQLLPPLLPLSLLSLICSVDPATTPYTLTSPSNPFLGKKILVLSSAKDSVVPWSCSREFVEALEVGKGRKDVVVDDEAGHECTRLMVKKMSNFVREEMLISVVQSRETGGPSNLNVPLTNSCRG